MPDISSSVYGAVFLIVARGLDATEYLLCRDDLIRSHHEELSIDGEDTVLRQDREECMLRKKRLCKVYEISDRSIGMVCPPARKLEAITRFFSLFARSRLLLLDMGESCRIAVVLRMSSIGYDEELDIFKKSARCPEALSLIAIDLVECFLYSDSSSLELDMYERESIHEDSDIIAIGPHTIIGGILIDDLECIVVDITLIEEIDIFILAIVTLQYLHMILLYRRRFLDDMLVLIRYRSREKMFPLRITELIFIELFELFSEVSLQVSLTSYREVLIGLLLELCDEFFFECILTLILLRSARRWSIVRDDGALGVLYDEMGIRVGHKVLLNH